MPALLGAIARLCQPACPVTPARRLGYSRQGTGATDRSPRPTDRRWGQPSSRQRQKGWPAGSSNTRTFFCG